MRWRQARLVKRCLWLTSAPSSILNFQDFQSSKL
jgi:hypothetical protein